jgi:hypothetical protein
VAVIAIMSTLPYLPEVQRQAAPTMRDVGDAWREVEANRHRELDAFCATLVASTERGLWTGNDRRLCAVARDRYSRNTTDKTSVRCAVICEQMLQRP